MADVASLEGIWEDSVGLLEAVWLKGVVEARRKVLVPLAVRGLQNGSQRGARRAWLKCNRA